MLLPAPTPFSCTRCGERVRNVVTVDGGIVTIEAFPHPDGNVIPWPGPSGNAQARARILDKPPSDQEAWRIHGCR